MDNQRKQSFKEFIKTNFTPNFLALIGALVITGVVVYGYATYLAWSNFNEAKKVAEEGQKQTQELQTLRQAQSKQKAQDPTASWQTYRNEELEFTLQHPRGWFIIEDNGKGLVGLSNLPVSGKAEILPDELSVFIVKGCVGEIQNDFKIELELYMVKNICRDGFSISLMIPTTNSRIDTNKKILDQILSTFRFLDKTVGGQFCGGIAGIACPTGYDCKLDGSYPDAGGVCITNNK
ncbi:MAG: hypothetical protein Q8Q89_03080 [bacterium]|nr:hypothetical protein [bacterium]